MTNTYLQNSGDSIQEGPLVKEESGERHEAHQKHEGHNRKFMPLSVSFGNYLLF